MKQEDLRKIIREEYSKILSEQVDYDYAIGKFNDLYNELLTAIHHILPVYGSIGERLR